MKSNTRYHLQRLLEGYPKLVITEDSIISAFDVMSNAFLNYGKLLVCGNGGSAADADHIVGELMKGFLSKRPIGNELVNRLNSHDDSGELSNHLQLALPAINLSAHVALNTAICNDVSADIVFAQQVLGYGVAGDVLFGISTSGNSQNVINAAIVAKILDMKTIGLTGTDSGKMDEIFDIVIKVPSNFTSSIQELHLPVYHTLCAMLEEEIFQ